MRQVEKKRYEPLLVKKLRSCIFFSILIFFSFSFHSGEQRIFIVNTTDDNVDKDLADNICADKKGNCTLRAAIQNANKTRAKDLIHFDISGTGPFKISVRENLPEIIEPLELDATTQKGYSFNNPQIILSGEKIIPEEPPSQLGPIITGFALVKRSSGSTVKGFVIGGFGHMNFKLDGIEYPVYHGYGIFIESGQNRITGNFLGISADGNNKFSNVWGVAVYSDEKNYIGGKEPEERNIVSSNHLAGIFLYSNTEVNGNFIGTNFSGDCAVGNTTGITMVYFSEKNSIKNNLISGNSRGIYVIGKKHLISGNLIGTNKEGNLAVPNSVGIMLCDTKNSVIGSNNVVSGNKIGVGIVEQRYKEPQNNRIQGNLIGTDISGTFSVPNETGIIINKGQDIIIGGGKPGHRNIISGNSRAGINLEGTKNNLIYGNYIGTDFTGTKALPNSTGIIFTKNSEEDSQNNLVMGNLISGNSGNGVSINAGRYNSLVENYIGTEKDLVSPLSNLENGIVVHPASVENCIGGVQPENANIIAFNSGFGILIKNESPDLPNEDVRLLHNEIFGNCKSDVFFAVSEEGLD